MTNRLPSALVIYNPVAGRFPSRLLTERAAAIFQKQGWKIEIETTLSGDHIESLSYQAANANLDALIVVGGDGSINRALPGLVGTQTALGVLPAGTSNVWAQEFNLPGLSYTRWMALEESARRLASSKINRVDVGRCDGHYFLLWAGIGLDAFIVHSIEPRRQWEKHFAFVHYATSVVWKASTWKGIDLEISSVDGNVYGRYMLAVISNIRLYAGGLARISPNAVLDDGVMDLWLFEGESLEDTLHQAWNLWLGRHVLSDRVRYIPFQQLSLHSDQTIFLELDGEPDVGGRQVNIEVIPDAINILVPQGTSTGLFKHKL
jgi:YegS/Rv2252/BmrU family lipid kinase